jgi:hypothetical protein
MDVKIEYLIVESKLFEARLTQVQQRLNELGSEGWELAAACGVHGQTLVFKRELPTARAKRKASAE